MFHPGVRVVVVVVGDGWGKLQERKSTRGRWGETSFIVIKEETKRRSRLWEGSARATWTTQPAEELSILCIALPF